MSFYLQAFWLNLKKIRKPAYMLGILWLMLLFGIVCVIVGKSQTVLRIEFGIIADLEDEFSREIIQAFPERNEFVLHVLGPESLPEARDKVAAGQWECLYVIHDDIAQKVMENDFTGLCDVYVSSDSKLHAILNEMFYAAIIKSSAVHITSDEIAYLMDVDYEQIKPYIETEMARYMEKDIFVTSRSSYVDGMEEAQQADYSFAIRFLHGGLSLIVLIVSLFLATVFMEEKKKDFYILLPDKRRVQYQFSIFSIFAAVNSALFFCGLLFICVFCGNAYLGFFREAAMALAYIFAVSSLNLLLVRLLPSGDFIYISFIFVLLLYILFGGILLDLNQINSLLGSVSRLFLSGYYIDGLFFGNRYSLALWFFFAACMGLWFVSVFQKRSTK